MLGKTTPTVGERVLITGPTTQNQRYLGRSCRADTGQITVHRISFGIVAN